MVGDSAGLNRLTDSYGFSHLSRAITVNASLSKPFWNDAQFQDKGVQHGHRTGDGVVHGAGLVYRLIGDVYQ